MKKHLLFLTFLMISVFSFAYNAKEKSEVTQITIPNSYIIYTTYTINKADITLPLVIQVPAPPTGTVIGINGPVRPNHTNWSISNGTLTLTYTKEFEIFDLREGGDFFIEVPTSPMPSINPNQGYVILLRVE